MSSVQYIPLRNTKLSTYLLVFLLLMYNFFSRYRQVDEEQSDLYTTMNGSIFTSIANDVSKKKLYTYIYFGLLKRYSSFLNPN